MPTAIIFGVQTLLGYTAWLLCFGAYLWPRLKQMEPMAAQRWIATLHSFRFFGLVFILPGVVGPHLPPGFAVFSAWFDLLTGVLAMLALITVKSPRAFLAFVIAFNAVGAADILIDYYHGAEFGVPVVAGQLGAAYAIVTVYVPLLMITHVAALLLLVRHRRAADHPALP